MNNLTPQFDFDDILIVPKLNTTISSRYNDIELPHKLPLFTAPMDTVVDLKNMRNFLALGINVTLPRTIKYSEFSEVCKHTNYFNDVFTSFGFNDLDWLEKSSYRTLPYEAKILIDVANGHMKKIVEYCNDIKGHRPDIKIMVGNIANPDTYYWYANENCVDYIRVGIGNGGGCLTTKQSGVGYPMASLIHATRNAKTQYENFGMGKPGFIKRKTPAIVADGGMKNYSDIVKALALGADYVMIGSIFNKAFESCSPNYLYGIKLNQKLGEYFFDHGYPVKKYFRGMSTKDAQKAMGKTRFKTSEGVVRFRKVEYHLNGWVENFEHYLRNAMSYSDAYTLEEFIGKVEICQITKNAYDRFNK